MIYLGTSPGNPEIDRMLDTHDGFGLMCQPGTNHPRAGWLWAADNGCFNDKWDPARWYRWLNDDHPRAGCLFATVPDVVGDHAATLERWIDYADAVVEARYPAAFVAQDGCTPDTIPTDCDAVFIGGSTEFKLSETARAICEQARSEQKWVHVGRVNGHDRFQSLTSHADSVDGTVLAYGPDKNAHRVRRWIDAHRAQAQLPLTTRSTA